MSGISKDCAEQMMLASNVIPHHLVQFHVQIGNLQVLPGSNSPLVLWRDLVRHKHFLWKSRNKNKTHTQKKTLNCDAK